MKQIFLKIKNFFNRVEDILADYVGMQQQVAYNYAYVSGKIRHISKIPKKDFTDKGLTELSDLTHYVSGAISDFRDRFNNFLVKFNLNNYKSGGLEDKIKQNHTLTNPQTQNTNIKKLEIFSNYTSAMTYLKSNSSNETKKVINILDGSKAWKWEKRAELFQDYFNKTDKNDLDKYSLKKAIEKNSYLKNNHLKIYEQIMSCLK